MSTDAPAGGETAILYVCTTCRRGTGETPCPGARLFAAIGAAAAPAGVRVQGVECLSACSAGCAIALAAPGKWTYLYGGIDPDLAGTTSLVAEILRGAALYAASTDGIPPWRERPDLFRKNVLGRTPPLAPASAAPAGPASDAA